jgi:16S rRNA (adenine1518-N6/adenine1519-N6)-dimethyltransferase
MQARKRFGQHFLTDRRVIERMVDCIAPMHDDLMVEIGPGRGALTTPLYERLATLHAVEFDRDLIVWLRETFLSQRFVLHESDALRFDFSQLAQEPHSLRVVGNLPYNISTPLIFHLLEQASSIRDMHFMLQKEVVDRLTASPGSKDWGRLSVMVQYACQADYLFFVPPGAFSPPPRVDSAIVRLTPHHEPPHKADDFALFEQLVRQVFSQRRKAIRNGVKSWLNSEQIEAAGVSPDARPDDLAVVDLVALANAASHLRRS